nr:WXG100 family type VII secretion target [Nocardia bovistercoris]
MFGTWKGAAADSYRTGWDEMHDGALKAWDALTDLAAKLGVTAAELQNQDDSTATGISTLDLPRRHVR